MKPFKVLSIDFDYFVAATSQEKWEFPDPNENLGIDLNTQLWMNRYSQWRYSAKSNNTRLLTDVSVSPAYGQVVKYLKSLSTVSKVYVTNSHALIYNFLEHIKSPIKLLNLDDHSDFYGIGAELNCGNWGNLLFDLLKEQNLLKDSEINWVHNLDSFNKAEFTENYQKYSELLTESYVLPKDLGNYLKSYFDEETPDMIYLCRSSCWVPPHLDYKFLEMSKVIINRSEYSKVESKVTVSRYTKEFKHGVSEYYKALKDLNSI